MIVETMVLKQQYLQAKEHSNPTILILEDKNEEIRYNGVVAIYFTKTQQDHYVLKSRYVIAQANGKVRVRRLETLTKILTFHQGNRFALGFLIFVMLIVEKEPITRQHGFLKNCIMN